MVIGQYLYTSYGLPELPEQKFFFLLASLLFSLMAAILTHRLIENPIRFGKPAQWRLCTQLLLALCLMAVSSYSFMRWYQETEKWKMQNGNSETSITSDMPVIYEHGCDSSFRDDTLNPCIYGNKNAQKTAILIGDSVGAQWFPAIARMHDPDEWKIVVLTKSSCPIVDEPYFSKRLGREFIQCTSWRKQAIAWLEKNPAQRLFIGSTRYDFSPEQWEQGTLRILARIAPHMQAIYFIEATPQLPFSGPDCLQQREPELCHAKFNDPRQAVIENALKQAIAQHRNAHWLNTAEFVCPGNLCRAQRQINGRDIAVFRDEQHITASFAAEAASYFLDQIKD